jgi:hypothetical protein
VVQSLLTVTSPRANRRGLDHPTIDHPERRWVTGAGSRPAHLRFFPKSWNGFFRTAGE